MVNMPRRTLFVLLSIILVVLLSGLVLREIIIKDIQHLLEGAPTDKAGPFINRSGNLVLAWSFFVAFLVFVTGILLSRKTAVPVSQPVHATARNSESDVKPAMSAVQETASIPEKGLARAAETINKGETKPGGITVSIIEEEQGSVEEDRADAGDQELQPHVDDPDRLKKIIKGLDDLAKAQALGRALQKQQLELALHLNDAVEKTRSSMQDKEILFNLECENGLTMAVDPECLSGIMSNLLDNAAKAVKNGGTVAVSATSDNGHVVFAVRDTGTGIKRKDLPHIFERFYRASGNGIGLGLTIVRELAEACGGKIEVQTTRGKGSQVTVRIPHA